jgi:hypothetical protein
MTPARSWTRASPPNRLLDALLARSRLISLFFTGLGVMLAIFFWWQLTSTGGKPVDVHAYWAADPNNLYPPSTLTLHQDAYLYSPPFELVVGWGRHLSFEVFAAIWRALLLGVLVYLAGPFTVFLLFLFPVASEINAGNIQLLLALAIVLAMRGGRWSSAWAFVLLTKVTPGVGLLWLLLLRRWHELAIALGVTAVIALATFIVWSDRWFGWIQLLANGSVPPVPPFNLPFPPRVGVAVLIVAIAAWRGWKWPLVVAGTLALPAFYTLSPSMFVGVLPFARAAFGRWRARRLEQGPAVVHRGIL